MLTWETGQHQTCSKFFSEEWNIDTLPGAIKSNGKYKSRTWWCHISNTNVRCFEDSDHLQWFPVLLAEGRKQTCMVKDLEGHTEISENAI